MAKDKTCRTDSAQAKTPTVAGHRSGGKVGGNLGVTVGVPVKLCRMRRTTCLHRIKNKCIMINQPIKNRSTINIKLMLIKSQKMTLSIHLRRRLETMRKNRLTSKQKKRLDRNLRKKLVARLRKKLASKLKRKRALRLRKKQGDKLRKKQVAK